MKQLLATITVLATLAVFVSMNSQVVAASKKETVSLYGNEQKRKGWLRKEIKELMDAFGIKYIEAESEADTLCAKLCLAGFAQACLSDDMDMFVYGIPIVLRHLSLFNHTVVMYNYSRILDDLDINGNDFKDILLLSKNDYNSTKSYNIYDVIKKHNNYRTALYNEEYDSNFPKWCSKELNDFDESEYEKSSKCFHIDKNINIDVMNILKKYEDVNKEKVKEIMKRYNFIFV